ncbi:MAG: phosphoribosylformylglycinamidine cyclo-ligase [bacterium]|nr:phosphoribosylformylglycinamidine cyclo-ligase [bacterium]
MDYKKAGVDIDAGSKAVDLIKKNVSSTYDNNVLNSLGGFAAMYELPEYKNPVLVSCTDGVGTKLKLAIDLNRLNTVGIDLVAMSINDLICCGAKPLFFLDYIACNKLLPEQMKEIVDGIVEGCRQSECSLIGGEMAEMNDLYNKGEFDLAGFAVGVVEKHERIDGSKIQPQNYIYALSSSGIHSNGFSLVRKVIDEKTAEENNIEMKELLEPTKIYVKEIRNLISRGCIRGIAHITGGGIKENLIRILPEGVRAEIKKEVIKTPDIFNIIKNAGNISQDEMYRVFNMGAGMIVVSSEKLEETKDMYQIGLIQEGSREVVFD